jgi:hypothetical protein
MFLSRDDLQELTDSPRKDRQIKWLLDHGVRFVVSLSGRPKVLQAEIERVMLGGLRNQSAQPNFTKLNG